MAWIQVVAIELTDCPTDYGLWFSFLFMHQTHVPLSVAMSVNLVTIICRVGDVTTLCQMKHCASRGLCKLFFFLYHLSWLCFCCCVIAWLVVCVGVWLHACLLECFWLLEPGCAFCVCVWPNHLLVVGGWMLVFVFALGDVAKKETKMHFFLTCWVTPLSCCTLRLPENIERFAGY